MTAVQVAEHWLTVEKDLNWMTAVFTRCIFRR